MQYKTLYYNMKEVIAYESFDDKLFHTKEKCLKHETEKKIG